MPAFVRASSRAKAYTRDNGTRMVSFSRAKKDPYSRARGAWAKLDMKIKGAKSPQRIATLQKRRRAVSKYF